MSLDDEAAAELVDLAAQHRLRGERIVDGRQGPEIVVDGRRIVSFAANDYLGLAGDRRIAKVAGEALEAVGVGSGASRLIVGNHRAHVELEAALAAWLEVTGVRTFSSGYAANVGVITALVRAGDVVFSDALNHASIIDGCRLSRAHVVVYPHRDLAALDALLRTETGKRRIVITESLFSMDGDIADLAGIAELAARHRVSWMVDEAHALGVYGPEGRGIAASIGVKPDVLVGTFGKAFGTTGAFVAASRAITDVIWNRARSFVFSTGTPPALSTATAAALAIVRGPEGDDRRGKLRELVGLARSLARFGGDFGSPIAPLVIGDDRKVMALSAALFEAGVFAQGIRPPTVPVGGARLRFGFSASHTTAQVEHAAALVGKIA